MLFILELSLYCCCSFSSRYSTCTSLQVFFLVPPFKNFCQDLHKCNQIYMSDLLCQYSHIPLLKTKQKTWTTDVFHWRHIFVSYLDPRPSWRYLDLKNSMSKTLNVHFCQNIKCQNNRKAMRNMGICKNRWRTRHREIQWYNRKVLLIRSQHTSYSPSWKSACLPSHHSLYVSSAFVSNMKNVE